MGITNIGIRNPFYYKRSKEDRTILELGLEVGNHKLYFFKDWQQIPVLRMARAKFGGMRYMLRLGNVDYAAAEDANMAAINEGNLVKISTNISAQKYLRESTHQIGLNFELVGHTILVDDEPIKNANSLKHIEIKEKLLQENEEVRAFFFLKSNEFLMKYGYATKDLQTLKSTTREKMWKVESLYLAMLNQPKLRDKWNSKLWT